MHNIEPIHTTSLVLREFTKEDVPKMYVMSLEAGNATQAATKKVPREEVSKTQKYP
jgi:hypothetical protein